MKLLFITQVVDENDAVLGAYPGWIRALAERFESVEVICLRRGEYNFPPNVHVYSLGKENGKRSRFAYSLSFLSLVWKLRHRYDAVFVHMNQEYLLLAGPLWKVLGKRMYMWRNHYDGSFLTDVAASFCTKVFCTSKHSYTAKYAKTRFMPVGIDATRFLKEDTDARVERSILFLSRIAPSKRPEMLIEALKILKDRDVAFSATFVGSPLPADAAYYTSLQEKVVALGMKDDVAFMSAVPNSETPKVYQSHDLFVNCSRSGMFDKTLFEAAAAGCVVFASSEDFKAAAGETFYFNDANELSNRLEEHLSQSADATIRIREKMRSLSRMESLGTLADRLVQEIGV
jgi:glycosyltransferase involved in cell wall biosynthesis